MELNEFVLVAMNPESTREELMVNVAVAYATYDAVYDASYTAAYVAVAAYDVDNAEYWLNDFFEVSGHNKQDYLDEIARINGVK